VLVRPNFLLVPFAYHQAIEYSLARANQRMPKSRMISATSPVKLRSQSLRLGHYSPYAG
jgi:hypothetical protein